MKYTSIKNPKWTNAEKTQLVCDVKFDTFPDFIQFVADPKDPEQHGRDIFQYVIANFPNIEAYVPPVATTTTTETSATSTTQAA
jgi:hypothetical protein